LKIITSEIVNPCSEIKIGILISVPRGEKPNVETVLTSKIVGDNSNNGGIDNGFVSFVKI